jgi:hypothetical protein
MNLLDLLDSTGGQQSLKNLAGNLGLDAASTNSLVDALAPMLMGALQKQTASGNGLENLKRALQNGGHQAYLEQPDSMFSKAAVKDGNNILGHLLGSKDVSRNVAAHASRSTGIDTSLVKQALPLLAGLLMGAVSKKSNAGDLLDDQASDLFDSLTGGDGFDAGDVLNLARKFF